MQMNLNEITANSYLKINSSLPSSVKLIAISKTHPANIILDFYKLGQKAFGENKVQELLSKYEALPKDIEWHMVGHMQTNKVKYIAPFISYIHSIDSLKLLEIINNEAQKSNRIINCLCEVHIAKEESKFGLDEKGLISLFSSNTYKTFENIRIVGLMGMATFTNNMDLVRTEFKTLSEIFKRIKEQFFPDDVHFKELSMGMSDDYMIAIEEGSTMIRLGTILFGNRTYT
jgi:PLP dependent protein